MEEKKEMTVEEVRSVAAQILGIHQKMKYQTLTPEERLEQTVTRIGMKSVRLLQNRVATALKHPDLVPAKIELPKLEQDTLLIAAFAEVLAALAEMRAKVDETLTVIGRPAIVSAASASVHIKVALDTVQRLVPTKRVRKSRAAPAPETPVVAHVPVQPDGSAVTVSVPVTPTTKAA